MFKNYNVKDIVNFFYLLSVIFSYLVYVYVIFELTTGDKTQKN